jgi:hypothetical protein
MSVRKVASRVSCPPPPNSGVLFPFFLLFFNFIFTVGLFAIYLSIFILYFPPSLLLYSIMFIQLSQLLHSRYPQQLYAACIHPSLTPLAVVTSHSLLPRRTFHNLR